MTSQLEQKLLEDVARIRDKVREMGDLALRGLEDSVASLTEGDTRRAYSAILRDSRIDKLESHIDGLCVEFIVRHIPVAAQLRFVHSVAKIVSELERVGDYAESINRQAILLAPDADKIDFSKFEELASVAIRMMRQAIRSFLDEDLELAQETRTLDRRTNQLHQEIYRNLQREIPLDSEELARLFSLLSVANRYERVADQACNICEEVFYIVSGEVVKHRLRRDIQILFVTRAASPQGLIAESIARAVADEHFDFETASLGPGSPPPAAAKYLSSAGIDCSAYSPEPLEEIDDLRSYKAIIALGPEAAEAMAQPPLGYRSIVLDWNFDDPGNGLDGESLREAYAKLFDDIEELVVKLIKSLHGTVSPLTAKQNVTS